jgi:RNA recognition motif-containing protein
MALIKMSKIEDGINALSNLHNHDLSGRKLQISFTKSKI